ncbi:hypothetical protein EJ08DRAFT_579555 [Tothia fuscella]|uniref:N-acetyltransferase domain-containing protein n=1 Tax=Tothia fuscella TaxID=1048955 RepID=A0A9P4U3H1_9PEZI|nr:hypothetical protein EJ08DRAFT_579555 [Tothia fuscella]
MPVRAARFGDLNRIAKIFNDAFWDEDATGRFMHPYRNEYPNDVLERYWLRETREAFWDCNSVLMVAGLTDSGEVVGAGKWECHGKKTGRWNWSEYNPIVVVMNNSVILYNRISAYIWPNRACDPKTINAYTEANLFFTHHWTGRRSSCLALERLGVHPIHQGEGHGRELVQWGLERAAQEKTAASVVCAYDTQGFYRKCGYDVEVGNVTEGEENPLAGVLGGTILFKDMEDTADGGWSG